MKTKPYTYRDVVTALKHRNQYEPPDRKANIFIGVYIGGAIDNNMIPIISPRRVLDRVRDVSRERVAWARRNIGSI